jgi:hypothetical protein
MYRQVSVDIPVSLAGGGSTPLPMAEAIDAVLSEPRFSDWIATEPESSWTYVNVFLTNGHGEGITAGGPAWEIDLIRETGVPRSWAIAFVDALSGKVVSTNFCDSPCER